MSDVKNNYNKNDKLFKILKQSYKKLKSYSYHDNKNIFLKKRIVEFEEKNKYNLNEVFKNLANDIRNNNIVERYIEENDKKNFKIRILPKKLDYKNHKSKVISNLVDNKDYKINKVIHFLDISIEAQIIGVLWILCIGEDIEKTYRKYTAGNMLDEMFLKDNLNLFKPYHIQYAKWRDDAIEVVSNRMNEKKHTLMLSLDIKEYFYSTNIDYKLKQDLDDIIQKRNNDLNKNYDLNSQNIDTINFFVIKVLDKYSKKISPSDRILLPIGFIPSCILCNWYLKDFDQDVISKLNPLYYKRYVDDIIIVLNGEFLEDGGYEIESISEEYLFEKLFFNTNILKFSIMMSKNYKQSEEVNIYKLDTKEDIILFLKNIPKDQVEIKINILNILTKLLKENNETELISKFKKSNFELAYKDWNIKKYVINIKGEKKDFFHILDNIFNNKKNCEEFSNQLIHCIGENNNNIKKVYLIKKFCQEEKKTILCIQDEKIKIYDFNGNGSKALIENFKKELKENASVFRFLPEKNEVLNNFDNEVYKIDYKDSTYKFSDINNINISRYNLSKFLARIIYSDKLENETYTKDVDEKILWIFKGATAIEFYFLWSKVFNYYLLNDNYEYIKDIFVNIYSILENLDIKLDKFTLNKLKDNEKKIKKDLKNNLKEYLRIVLSMTYSLNDELFLAELSEYNIKSTDNNYLNADEKFRISNMLDHTLIRYPLMNYNYKQGTGIINYVNDKLELKNIKSDMRCYKINTNYKKCFFNNYNNNYNKYCYNYICKNKGECLNDIRDFNKTYNPRFVHLHECILYSINCIMAKGKIISKGEEIKEGIELFEKINNIKVDMRNIINYERDNKEKFQGTHWEYFNKDDYLFVQNDININYIEANKREKKDKLKIGIINMQVYDENLKNSFNKTANLESKRLECLNKLLNNAVKSGAEMIIFPEVSIPIQWLGVIANFSKKHDVAIICGLEHVIYENGLCCNYTATILPERYKDYSYSLIKLRIKNYYSPIEKEWVWGHRWKLPSESEIWHKEYDLFRWKGIDFCNFNCFELANVKDRSMFTSYVDLIIGVVHNKDINYYSNVMESLSRDAHCYFAHVNNSRMGDNRIVMPTSVNNKNILQITGGLNDTVLIGEIDIKSLREFQCLSHNMQILDKRFKPVPPEFNHNNVKIRSNLPL